MAGQGKGKLVNDLKGGSQNEPPFFMREIFINAIASIGGFGYRRMLLSHSHNLDEAIMSTLENFEINSWENSANTQIQTKAISALENGNVLFLPQLSFELAENEHHLLSPTYATGKKNISYNKLNGQLRGAQCEISDALLLKNLCDRFANHSKKLINQLFPIYTNALLIGRTSYRPVEIYGRKAASYKKDDTRLHVDAFPSSPTNGMRIMRVFSNINPNNQSRDWHIGEPFKNVAERFLPQVTKYNSFVAKMLKMSKITKTFRTHYDHIMLQIHDRMKKDIHYQATVSFQEVNFPANSTWIVFTDQVSHAALKGQFLLEQTFYLPTHAMEEPARSPLSVLEGMTGKSLL